MAFELHWLEEAKTKFLEIKTSALSAQVSRAKPNESKSSRHEGLYKQVVKCLVPLASDPRHPGLQTHELISIDHPFETGQPVFEAYVQNKTPGAYRVFWCYGPNRNEITIITITPHP